MTDDTPLSAPDALRQVRDLYLDELKNHIEVCDAETAAEVAISLAKIEYLTGLWESGAFEAFFSCAARFGWMRLAGEHQ